MIYHWLSEGLGLLNGFTDTFLSSASILFFFVFIAFIFAVISLLIYRR